MKERREELLERRRKGEYDTKKKIRPQHIPEF
jgi:hypothetical protein